jgi:hypothetical protein
MKSRWIKVLVGVFIAGAALLALTPFVFAAASDGGFGVRDGSGPIIGAHIGANDTTPMGPPAGRQAAMAGVMGGPQFSLVAVAAAQMQLEHTALVAELRSGKTIAQVASEHNVATATIVDAFVAAHAELLKAQVADGRLTQAQADALLAQARTHATEQISEPWSQWGS